MSTKAEVIILYKVIYGWPFQGSIFVVIISVACIWCHVHYCDLPLMNLQWHLLDSKSSGLKVYF